MHNDPVKKFKLVSICQPNHQLSHKSTNNNGIVDDRNNDRNGNRHNDSNGPLGSDVEGYITGQIINSLSPSKYKFSRFSHGSIAVILGAISCGVLIIITLYQLH